MGGVGFREDTEIDKARARDIRRGDLTEIDGIDDLLGEGAGIGFLALGQHHRGVALVIAEAEVGGGGDVRRSLPDVLRCRVGFMRGSLCRRHGGGKAAGLSLGEERVGTVSRKGGKAAVLCVMCVIGIEPQLWDANFGFCYKSVPICG